MRIINTRNVIQLSAAETKVWEDGGVRALLDI